MANKRSQRYELRLTTDGDKPLPMPPEIKAFLEAGMAATTTFKDTEVECVLENADSRNIGNNFDDWN